MAPNKKVQSSPPKTAQTFPIVGIGASAGGLDAFKKFLQSIDEHSGMAFVLVQHLAPEHESILPDILTRSTKLPLYEITDDINLAPDHVYIIPENKIVTAEDGVLKLSTRDPNSKTNRPIDIFFTSLAEVHKSFAIGAVFSGTGYDGTEGLKMIKEQGGITYAQSPESASFDSMPQNAINSGAVDFILSPEEIPQHLNHVKKAYQASNAYANDVELEDNEEDIFKQILRLLRLRSGNDFTHYKQPTLRRRIARRMVLTKNEKPEQYLNYLKAHTSEQDALFNDVLIPVTYFFRDIKIFDSLSETVFPIIMKNKPNNENIRVWVAGCSSGEEAYSLAICLHEFLMKKGLANKVQVFASDISENIIARARTAEYGKEDLQNVSEERIQKYFIKKGNVYQINKDIRDMCVFAVHNFLKDPPFAKIDLISCRNVLIYFNPVIQKKALATFHYALKKNGVLFLGKSETASSASNLFDPLVKNSKIYTRKSAPGGFKSGPFERRELNPNSFKASQIDPQRVALEPDFQKFANAIIFNRFTPAGVIIDQNKDIIHFHGDTSPYLVQSTGKPNLNIIKLAREGLAFELRNSFLKVKENQAISKKGIPIKGKDYLVDFDIIELPSNLETHYLVLFQKREVQEAQSESKNGKSADKQRIKMLEAELDQLREDIRGVTEDQEAANEELQSANEELLSSSEELQSLNEELETTTEELQSNNEELITVNDELMDRQDQLITERRNAEAIVETIREPLAILDNRMRVKKANNSFYNYFKTTEQDTEGRLIFELNNGQWNKSELRTMLEGIIPNKTKIEDFEFTGNFPNIGQHSILINARQILNGKHSEELILMAFEDVTELRMAKILRESEERFRIMADTAPFLLWISEADGNVNFLNKSWLDFTGRTIEEERGMGWAKGIHEEDLQTVLETYKKHFEEREEINIEYRLRRNDGEFRWVSVKGVPRFGPDGDFMGYVGGCMDIHEQKNFSSALEIKVDQRTKQLQESQNFLQTILNLTQNVIYIYDFRKEKIVFVNSRVENCTGHTPEEIELSDKDLYTPMIHKDDLDHVLTQRKKIKNSKNGKMVTMQYRIRNKDGSWTHQLSQGLIFNRDKTGKATQYIGVSTDITELKKANDLLWNKNKELEHSNTELASFSSIASHDLKEPLRKIQIFLKLLLEKDGSKISEESKEYLDRVVVSAHRMQQLIDDLISYSRTSIHKIKYTDIDLNELLDEVIDDLRENIEENKARIEIGKMPTVAVIPSQIRQLFVNLIGNAIKYKSQDRDPQISIIAEEADSNEIVSLDGNGNQKFCKIMVSDNGIGFPDQYKTQIFEPFQRLHGKDEYSGTGIGLAICKKIITNHHGFITAESREGEGSVFNIYVPLVK